MDQGDLVPDDVTIKMLQAEVDNNPDSAGFYLMAFQTLSQAEALDVFWLQNHYSNNH
jgi:adenylate kinase